MIPEDPAQVVTTGFLFVKGGLSLNFSADTANERILMLGKTDVIRLTVADAYMFRNILDQVISLVVDARDAHLNADKKDLDFNNLPELE